MTPKTLPRPIKPTPGAFRNISSPSETQYVMPSATDIMPSVATNGSSFSLVIRNPFTAPSAAPITMHSSTSSAVFPPTLIWMMLDTTAIIVRPVSIARSMPPVISTNMTPSAMTPLAAFCSRMPSRLLSVRNEGFAMVAAHIKITRMPMLTARFQSMCAFVPSLILLMSLPPGKIAFVPALTAPRASRSSATCGRRR